MGILFLVGVVDALLRPRRRQPRLRRLARRPARRARCRPAATWKARRSASASPTPRCSRPSPPTPRAARSTPCMTACMPLAGMVPMVNIMLGEIIFGGVGSGLYGMLLFVIVAVFIAGLMVGRTPEYLGKKIEAKEVKMAMLAILILPLSILGFTALAVVLPVGTGGDGQRRPARLHRGALRLHLGHRQQRQRLRRPVRQHAVLEHHAGLRDVHRPLPDDHADAGDRRLAGGKKIVPASAGTFPTDGGAVRRPADRRDRDRRRPDLLPGARARPDRRALRDARRHHCTDTEHDSPWTSRSRADAAPRSPTHVSTRRSSCPAIGQSLPQARSAR